MDTKFMDLTIPEYAYIFGLFQTDGHLGASSRNRGKFALEIKSSDDHILYDIQRLIPYNSSIYQRTRTTNFGSINTTSLNIFDLEFRTKINQLGIPYGNKASITTPPTEAYSVIDYFRGVIDGNGSLGFTSKNIPFLSLVTKSDSIASSYIDFVSSITHKTKTSKKNARDNVYNISIYNEDAINVSRTMYYDGCISMQRKFKLAKDICNWIRPVDMKIAPPRKRWSIDDDNYILNHTIKESASFLHRTESSIKTRLWRLQ